MSYTCLNEDMELAMVFCLNTVCSQNEYTDLHISHYVRASCWVWVLTEPSPKVILAMTVISDNDHISEHSTAAVDSIELNRCGSAIGLHEHNR